MTNITLDKQAATNSDLSVDAVREAIQHLFINSKERSARDKSDEAYLANMVDDFLFDHKITSEIDVATLAEQFKCSRISAEPSSFSSYLHNLSEHVTAHLVHTSSPRFIGHMTTALPSFVGPMAQLITAMNQNQVKLETSKALSFYERQALAMIHRLIYKNSDEFYREHAQRRESTLGIITTGGTLANITALWCARNSRLGPDGSFTGVDNEGLTAALEHYGYTDAVVIGSSQMHYSFEKAASALGIGVNNLLRVPVDENHQIVLPALERTIDQCRARKRCIIAIVAVAGTTETGAVDPLPKIADLAREIDTHLHIDAAWGGPLLFSERHCGLLKGIERADSAVIDGHKQMFLPMGIGMLVFRDPYFARAIEKQARYIIRAGSYDLGRRSLDGSRPGTVLFLHAALSVFGRKGYEFLIDEGIRKTQYLVACIRARREFEILIEPKMNILTYRFIPKPLRGRVINGDITDSDQATINVINERLQREERRAGRTFVSRTTLHATRYGRNIPITALRVVIANPNTTEDDIDAVLDDQIQIGNKISV